MIDFRKIWEGIKGMFTVSEMKTIAGQKTALSKDMINAIDTWNAMYLGKAEWTDEVPSLRIESGICREFADIAINEMDAHVSDGSLDELFQKAIKDLNENLQDGLALGSFIIKPLGADKVEYINADSFIPVTFDAEGNLLDCIFIEHKEEGSYHYFRCERHKLVENGLMISNKAYRSSTKTRLGVEIPLASIDEWAELSEETTYLGMDKLPFGYYRNPVKNRIDGSFCGVSIYNSAIDLIKRADIQGERLDWEYESGERAIYVDERALKKGKNGSIGVAKRKSRIYRGLDIEQSNGDLFKEFSPALRDDNMQKGLNDYLRLIEFNVGLAYGDLSDTQDVQKTATEIKTAKARKYNRVTAIQENLEECLQGLVDAIAFYNAKYTTNYELICSFKDSILTDEDTDRQRDREDVAMGVMSLAEYRAKWYGEDLETAEANLPEQSGVIMDDMKTAGTQTATSGAEVQGKGLNGAQTQSLIAIMAQYTSEQLSEGQAVNLIAAAIGVDKAQARALLNGDINEL